MVHLVRDIRIGLRRLRLNSGFSALAIGVLGFGLAASTAVFAYINAFFQPFPGADAAGVLRVHRVTTEVPYGNLSYPDYLDLRASQEGIFAGVEGIGSGFAASVRHEDFSEVIFGRAVTGGVFRLLGIELSLGRGLTEEDDRAGALPAVVISHAYWAERFGRREDTVGSTLVLNGNSYTIVGIAGSAFVGTSADLRPQVWFPFEEYKRVYWARSERASDREGSAISPYVRLAVGLSREQVASALASLGAGLDTVAPLRDGQRRLTLESATWVDPAARLSELPTARIMFAAAAALLLLACVNAANLMLALGTRRNREVALRCALGASRGRLIRQFLTETLLLSLAAGVVAVALAGPAASWIGSFFAQPSIWGANVPRVVRPDTRVFVVCLSFSVIAGVITGLLPALKASRQDLISSLRMAAAASKPSPVLRLDDLLTSAQIALCLALLVVAGHVLRTLEAAQDIDPGFRTQDVVASYVSTSSMGTPIEEREQFFRQLAERLEALPWVNAVAIADYAPLSPHNTAAVTAGEEGRPRPAALARVVAGYFEVLDIQLLAGRTFGPRDNLESRSVAIVNRTLADRFFGEGNPVGREISWTALRVEGEKRSEIVGVVDDTRLLTLMGEAEPQLYVSYPQVYYTPGNAVLVSTSIAPELAVARLEAEFRAVDPRLAVVNVIPYSEVLRGLVYSQRMNAELFGIVASLGLLLAAVGIFGVMNLSVALRAREIGIRIAVGAAPGDIVRLVLGRLFSALALGMAFGLVAAVAAARWTESLLYGIRPGDPPSFIAAILTLVVAALLAAYLPTRRALAVDPVRSLRVE